MKFKRTVLLATFVVMNSINFIKKIERHATQAPAPCEGFV